MWWTLSLHAPQQLAAEMALLVLSVLIYFYRVLGGSNEWLRTHGIILVTYYALGGIAYDELEGWTLLDTTYFLTVTVTTVGYGDMCPETPAGKIFTVIYALLGLVFVFAALSPLLDALIFIKDLLLKPCTPKEPMELAADDGGELHIEDLRRGGNWKFKYFSALMGPILVFILGLAIGWFVLDLDVRRHRLHVQDACAGSHVQDPMCRMHRVSWTASAHHPHPCRPTPSTPMPSMAYTGR